MNYIVYDFLTEDPKEQRREMTQAEFSREFEVVHLVDRTEQEWQTEQTEAEHEGKEGREVA